MVSFSTATSFGAVGLFIWYVGSMVYNVFVLFNPTTHIPYLSSGPPPIPYHEQYWPEDIQYSLSLYTSIKSDPKTLFRLDKQGNPLKTPLWELQDLTTTFDQESKLIPIPLPKKTRNNGTLYLHAFLTEKGKSPNPTAANYDSLNLYTSTSLTKFLKFMPNITRNLLSGEGADKNLSQLELEDQPILTHWKSFAQLEIVIDRNRYPRNGIPMDIQHRLLLINPERKYYLPMFYFNEIGLRRDHYTPLNLTHPVSTVPVTLGFRRASLGMSRIHNQFEGSFQALQQPNSPLRVSEKEIDNMRQMFFETAPTLLALTFLAAFLHMLFDFLAFKSDVSHWKNMETLSGTSRASVAFSAIASTLSALYLLDKRHETSILVLLGAFGSALGNLYIHTFWKKSSTGINFIII